MPNSLIPSLQNVSMLPAAWLPHGLTPAFRLCLCYLLPVCPMASHPASRVCPSHLLPVCPMASHPASRLCPSHLLPDCSMASHQPPDCVHLTCCLSAPWPHTSIQIVSISPAACLHHGLTPASRLCPSHLLGVCPMASHQPPDCVHLTCCLSASSLTPASRWCSWTITHKCH